MAKSQRRKTAKDERQNELIGVGLLAFAVFVLLTLLPTALVGSIESDWFPSGNFMGVVGSALDDAASSLENPAPEGPD